MPREGRPRSPRLSAFGCVRPRAKAPICCGRAPRPHNLTQVSESVNAFFALPRRFFRRGRDPDRSRTRRRVPRRSPDAGRRLRFSQPIEGIAAETRAGRALSRRQALPATRPRAPRGAPVSGIRRGGRGGEIRTHDLLYPKQTRYQAAPRPGPRPVSAGAARRKDLSTGRRRAMPPGLDPGRGAASACRARFPTPPPGRR